MKIFLSVGHSILANGNCTSADGRLRGGVLEYDYCKKLAPYVQRWLQAAGCEVTLVICPERKFTKSTQEKSYKIPIENKGGYDLAAELHLNAFNGVAHGTEVYYKTAKGKAFAERVDKKLATVFTDRGAQKRTNLYILNSTKAPAILIEVFFCDSLDDCAKAAAAGLDKIGRLIAEGITNKTLNTQQAQIQTTTTTSNGGKKTLAASNQITAKFPLVKKGYTGSAVKTLQTFLGTPVTGKWNDADMKSLKSFQKNVGLTQDGECGKNTWPKVAAHMCANTYTS